MRIGLEQREKLHPRRQRLQETVEARQCGIGMGGTAQASEKVGLDASEDLLRPGRTQRRIAVPAVDDRPGLVGEIRQGRAVRGREEGVGQGLDTLQPLAQPIAPGVEIAFAHHIGDVQQPVLLFRQVMGLGVVHHLDAMFDVAVLAVMIGQLAGDVIGNPALYRQSSQRPDRAASAQVGVAAAGDQLAGLGKELDLADAALAELHVMARNGQPAAQTLVIADPQPHVMGVLNGREIQMLAPDEGSQIVQETQACGDVAGTGPGLDIGGAFPGPALGLVIGKRRRGRKADRRHRRIGAQAQIGAEDIAVFGIVRQRRRHLAGCPDQRRPRLVLVARVIGCIVVKHDQVDVRAVIQLSRAHLAHGHGEDSAGIGIGVGQLATVDLAAQMGAQRKIGGAVGQIGQRAGDLFQPPGAAQIRQCRHQRDPALGLTQRRPERLGVEIGAAFQHPRDQIVGQSGPGQPFGLFLHQRPQIGAAPGRPRDQVGHRTGKAGKERPRLGGAGGVMGDGQAGDAISEIHDPS